MSEPGDDDERLAAIRKDRVSSPVPSLRNLATRPRKTGCALAPSDHPIPLDTAEVGSLTLHPSPQHAARGTCDAFSDSDFFWQVYSSSPSGRLWLGRVRSSRTRNKSRTTGSLVVDFEEGSLKRFASVEYQLDATETSRWESCGGGAIEVNAVHPAPPLLLEPDDKGRTTGNFTVPLPLSNQVCAPQHVEYTSVTLTNLTTGHVYRLDSISRDFP